MSKNQHLSSITKIFLTTTILVVTTLPTIAYPVKINQTKEETNINNYKEIYSSPCHKNPNLPQCK